MSSGGRKHWLEYEIGELSPRGDQHLLFLESHSFAGRSFETGLFMNIFLDFRNNGLTRGRRGWRRPNASAHRGQVNVPNFFGTFRDPRSTEMLTSTSYFYFYYYYFNLYLLSASPLSELGDVSLTRHLWKFAAVSERIRHFATLCSRCW